MKRFGLIGYPLTHSFSKKYFTEKFKREEIEDCIYELYQLENIDDVRLLFEVNKDLCGLNVTIPYKETIIHYLENLDDTAQKIGAVNCIHINEIEKTGFNTDCLGFRDAIKPLLQPHHKKALVLGTGGSSKAVVYALHELDIEHVCVSRTKSHSNFSYSDIDKTILEEYPIIINTSPVGMYPNLHVSPDIPYEYLTPSHLCFDLIYNPEETLFLQKAKHQGAQVKNGLEMLELQAEYAWKIWNQKS
ncbi:MAG: shikimate dehydrogenase [Chitinophagales bacterium]|nr:shikimate dehydrogenase [Chitinophagales bacterium]